MGLGDAIQSFFDNPVVDTCYNILIRGPLYVILAALSLLQLRNLLTTIGALSKLKLSANSNGLFKAAQPYLAEFYQLIAEMFGGESLPHLKSFTLNHYLVMAMMFAIFSLNNFFRENLRYRAPPPSASTQRAAPNPKKDD